MVDETKYKHNAGRRNQRKDRKNVKGNDNNTRTTSCNVLHQAIFSSLSRICTISKTMAFCMTIHKRLKRKMKLLMWTDSGIISALTAR